MYYVNKWTLNIQGYLFVVFFCMHVTYYQANICREHAKLCNNLSSYHLVVGFIVVGLFCYFGCHCNKCVWSEILMREFKDSQGFKLSSFMIWISIHFQFHSRLGSKKGKNDSMMFIWLLLQITYTWNKFKVK